MKITGEMMSAAAYRNNTQNKNKLQKDLEKLSSGYLINRAGDNAAGLVITERIRAHISGYTQAVSNAQDGVAIIRTFEGALGETQKMLIRFKSLAAESANGVYSDDTDRAAIELEYKQLLMEIDDIAETEFNGINIRDLDSTVNIETLKTLKTTAEKPIMRRMALRAAISPEPTLIDNMKTSWLTPALDKIKAATGLTLSDDITLEIKFDEDTNGVMECVAETRGADGRADALTLLINPAYINAEGDFTELESKLIDGVFIDNIFASALVQGVMLANIESPVLSNNPRTPVWFTKGLAEAAVGNNSFSDANTRAAAVAVNNTVSGLSATNAASTVNAGNGGFLFLHYLDNYGKGANKQGAYTAVNGGRIKDLCEALENSDRINDSTATFDKAFTAVYGMTWQNLLNQFKTQVNAVATGTGYASFLKNNLNIDIADDNHQEALGNTDSTPEKSIVGLPIEVPGDSSGGSGGDTDVPGGSDKPGDSGGGSDSDTDKPGFDMSKNVEKGGLTLQTGTYSKDLKRFQFNYKTDGLESDLDVTAKGLGLSDVNLANQKNANIALDFIDRAVSKVSAIRASFGAVQNRLESKIQNIKTSIGNLSSSESRIRDTDTAKQVTELVKTQLLDTVSAKMLVNSFSLSEKVIDLL